MNRTVIEKLLRLYDNLIDIASKNLNKTVMMDWGPWTPTKLGLDTMRTRRGKISSGKTVLTNFDNRL